MQIRVIYEPILRQTVAPVTVFDQALKSEAEQMQQIMRQNIGLGLAANQVGLDKQLIVYGYHRTDKKDELPEIPFTALCNLKVVKQSQAKATLTEGCLSLPGLELPVERPAGVTVQAQNLAGKPIIIKAKGLLARILQHETDHLNGILFTDRVAPAELKKISHYQHVKTVFLGSDDFSYEILNELIISQFNIMSVVTETAKRTGRGQAMSEPAVKKLAEEAGIAVFQPADEEELTKLLAQLEPDLLVLASYGKILSAAALKTAVYGSLNVHPSLLPKYRGATPIQSAILNGERETGVTIMRMQPQVDAGEILAQEKVAVEPSETTPTLKKKLAAVGAKLLTKTLPLYLSGQAKLQPQDSKAATKTTKLTKEMGEIDWQLPVAEIDRQIRAFQPWPGSFTYINSQRLKILEAEPSPAGLVLKKVQLEGKTPAAWKDFERGYQNQLTQTDWYAKIVK